MLNRNTVRFNRSYESFTVAGSEFEQRAGVIAGGMTARNAKESRNFEDVAMLDKPYTSNRDPHTGSIPGQVEDKLPGYPYQSMTTAFPRNKARNRTGPISTRELISALMQENENQTRSDAGQKAYT